jgi:hypothetical protein
MHGPNEELHNLYSPPNVIRVIKSKRMNWTKRNMSGKMRSANRILIGKPERKRPLERLRRRWEDNMRKDVKEAGC